MNDVSLVVSSVLGGALTGLYMVGFFTTRIDGRAVNIALGAAVVLNIYLGLGLLGWLPSALTLGLHSYWVGTVVNLVFVVVAFAAGWMRSPVARDMKGLTVWTQEDSGRPAE